MAKRIGSKQDPMDTPGYGGKTKPTGPGINKVMGKGPQDTHCLQRDNMKAEAKFNRGAAKPWKSRGKAASSKGTCDVPSDRPSQKRNDPKGVMKQGYGRK